MARQSILIVEDDARLRTILARNLERRGHQVRLAGSVTEARTALAAGLPDVLLLDVDLPDGTGWEVLDDPAGATTPAVVIMSAGQPARRRLEQFQPYCFLSKPFALDTLLRLIEQIGTEEGEGRAPPATSEARIETGRT